MKISSKTLLIAVVIAGIAIPLVLYQPVMANETDEIEADDVPMEQNTVEKPRLRCRARPILRFLKHAEAAELEGKEVALVRNILVLDVDGDPVRVLMPPKWTTMEGDVVESEVLVDGIDDETTITVKALEASFENPQGVTISLILAYEINAGEDYHAVLPFNISLVEEAA